jgi:hypothetical protein
MAASAVPKYAIQTRPIQRFSSTAAASLRPSLLTLRTDNPPEDLRRAINRITGSSFQVKGEAAWHGVKHHNVRYNTSLINSSANDSTAEQKRRHNRWGHTAGGSRDMGKPTW